MISGVSVLTSIVGGKDYLMEEQAEGNYIAYLDVPYMSETWTTKRAPELFYDPRRDSRVPKLLSHLYTDTEYSIWIDGNMSLLKPPEELIERYLKNHDIALFKHPKRDCIYDEAVRCATAGLDDPEVIIEQVKRYENAGYAKHKGLCECGVLIRRHTPKLIEFNNYWFAEYSRGCVRDQISFMYAVDKTGIRVNVIDSPWYTDGSNVAYRDDFIKIVPHEIPNPQAL